MADKGNGGAAPSEKPKVTETWTTGDPDKDWARYEGCIDRIDVAVRYRFACLLGFEVLLAFVLAFIAAGGSGGNQELKIALTSLLPWLGFVVSLVVYWAQYRALEYRTMLRSGWTALYPDTFPTPFGKRARESERPSVGSDALVPLLSGGVWLGVGGILLLGEFWPGFHMPPSMFTGLIMWGTLAAYGVTLIVFYVCAGFYTTSRHPE